MAKIVAEVFIETLVKAGVRRVYGVSGDSLNGLTDTIRKNKKIEWLHVRHEEVAAFAAGAAAQPSVENPRWPRRCGPRHPHPLKRPLRFPPKPGSRLPPAAPIPPHPHGRP